MCRRVCPVVIHTVLPGVGPYSAHLPPDCQTGDGVTKSLLEQYTVDPSSMRCRPSGARKYLGEFCIDSECILSSSTYSPGSAEPRPGTVRKTCGDADATCSGSTIAFGSGREVVRFSLNDDG